MIFKQTFTDEGTSMADNNMPITKQPTLKSGRNSGSYQLGRPNYMAGGSRSIARLRNLDFDPIKVLVDKYNELELEVERQKKIRDGRIVELTATGRPKSYRPEIHHALYDKQVSIGEKLLRYAYGRVPETNTDEQKPAMPLVVNLTKKGETYIVNDSNEDNMFNEDGITDENDDADSY